MITILLPSYNEEKDLPPLLSRIQQTMIAGEESYRVLVVNDGSRDGTLKVAHEWAEKMPLLILDHGTNQGLGRAMLTGFTEFVRTGKPGDILAAMDADNTHDPALIHRMVEKVSQGKDVVIASRYELGGEEIGLTPARKVLSRGASFLLHLFFPIPGAQDYTCGFRAYRWEILQKAFEVYGSQMVGERGFTCMAEILIKLHLLSARICEVPLILRYDFKSGESKMKFVRTIGRYLVLIFSLKTGWSRKLHPKAA